MSPRADYECRTCEKTIPDLPTESTRCPICGKKRGFRRLYNRIQVNRRRPRPARILEGKKDAVRYIDEQMMPAYENVSEVKAGAKRYEAGIAEVKDRMWEKAADMGEVGRQAREVIAQSPMAQGAGTMARSMSAKAAFGALSPASRAESLHVNWPVIELKKEVAVHKRPRWVKPGG